VCGSSFSNLDVTQMLDRAGTDENQVEIKAEYPNSIAYHPRTANPIFDEEVQAEAWC
jgi:hypothetical protein